MDLFNNQQPIPYNKNDDVVILTIDDFKIVKDKRGSKLMLTKNKLDKRGVLKAYAFWCPHCVRRYDTFRNLATTLKQDFTVYVCDVAAIKPQTKLQERKHELLNKMVKYYPTMLLVSSRGNITKANFGADEDEVLEGINEHYGKVKNVN